MEQAITTSESGIPKKTYLLLALNVVGVLLCILVTTFLILWALCIVLPEPNTPEIVEQFIELYKKNKSYYTSQYKHPLQIHYS